MTERILVRIGTIGTLSQVNVDKPKEHQDDIKWLRDTFEISYKRAQRLIDKLKMQVNSPSRYLEVVLTYRQLARYTAKRQVDGLNKFWKYPAVLAFDPNEVIEVERPPMELRPGIRPVP